MRVVAANPRKRGRRGRVEGLVDVRAAGAALRAREGGHGRARVHDHRLYLGRRADEYVNMINHHHIKVPVQARIVETASLPSRPPPERKRQSCRRAMKKNEAHFEILSPTRFFFKPFDIAVQLPQDQ